FPTGRASWLSLELQAKKEDPSSLKIKFHAKPEPDFNTRFKSSFFTLVFRPLRATSLTQHDRMLFIFKIESRGN
ncbi:hypothetical protein ABNIH20_19277, partial [Acinetobacter baumannii ABNIH20]|uniref:hypothetical protein n=1 Tax=Acinetobacter baumannii TaxID=470 RepID=UPI0002CB0FA2